LRLGRKKQVTEALKLCDDIATKFPAESLYGSEVVILRTGGGTTKQLNAVERDLAEAVKRNKSSILLLRVSAELQELRQQHSKAIAFHRQILKLDPKDVVALNNLAWLLALHAGQPGEAVKLANQGIELVGPVADLLDTRGVAHLKAGDAKLAVDDFKEALSHGPTGPLYFHLAEALWAADDKSGAKAAWRKAVDLKLSERAIHALEKRDYLKLQPEMK
jgi:Tfp pilus assembly protein PilF